MLGNKPLYKWAIDKYLKHLPVYIYCDRESYSEIDYPEINWIEEESCPVKGQDANQLFRKMLLGVDYEELDYVMFFTVTTPYISEHTIQAALETIEDSKYDSVVSAIPIQGRLWGKEYLNHDPSTCPRTQDQEVVYLESEAFWLIEPRLMLEETRKVGHSPCFLSVFGEETIDIDTETDWEYACKWL